MRSTWTFFCKGTVAELLLLFLLGTSLSFREQLRAQTPPPPKTPSKPPPETEEVDPNDVIRINTTLVNSPVLVIGRDGKFVPNLRRADFQVFEDGIEQQVAFFAPVEKPFTVALLIDTSRSTLHDFQTIQSAAISFIDKMRPDDQALVVSFSNEIKVLTDSTRDHETLKRAILNCRPEGGSRIYDAISFVLSERMAQISGRTAVLLFTDGVDNDSREATYQSSLENIQRSQSLIYPVQFSTFDYLKSQKAPEGSGFSTQDYVRADAYLHEAAVISGTGVYPAQNISDLDFAIANIVNELHNEYDVGYYPRNPPEPRKQRRVEVRTKLPQLVVRARTSYSRDPSGALIRMKPLDNSQPNTNVIGATPLRRNIAEAKADPDARWMCKGPDTPTEFVVVKEGFVSNCPKSLRVNDVTNAWFIRRPRDIETMCKGFLMWRGRELPGAPIPTGYIVTSETVSLDCSASNVPGNKANAWVIRKPTGRDVVCKGFQIPRGFVTAEETSVAGCPVNFKGKNAWIIRPK